ncbi:MAG TPA: GNAT family N-acetyltransferase [Gaiellaceae bacterium]|nr:GNAT family N-acetyltransferase [Gaiellaceae bacterium]
MSREELAEIAAVADTVAGYRISLDELEHERATEPDIAFVLARIDGELVGSGIGKRSSMQGTLYAMARVLPDRRRRGAGSALYAELSEHARRLGLEELWGRVDAGDEQALEFVRHRGFREFSREIESVLTIAETPPPCVDPPPGITITNLGDRPDLAEACHAVDAEGVPDIPVEAEFVAAPFERWRARTLEGPDALPHACAVALAGDEVVGYAALLARHAQPGTAEHQLTAVRRAWRRRGIATALKRAQIAWAAAAGFERLVTFNDEVNMAMRGVNAQLGYEARPPVLLVRGPLVSAAADRAR